MKLILAILFGACLPALASAQLTEGALDPTFGTGGRTTIPFDLGNSKADHAYGSVLQPDGKLIIVGTATNANGNEDFAITRLLPNGTPDPGFGTNGKVTRGFDLGGANNDVAAAVTLESDGNIIVIGTVDYPNPDQYAQQLLALHADGSFLASSVPIAQTRGNDVRILPDGKIVSVGQTVSGGFSVNEFSSNLSSNPSSQTYSLLPVGGASAEAASIALRPDGTITVAGGFSPIDPNTRGSCFVAQLHTDLSLDTNFGMNNSGISTFRFNLGSEFHDDACFSHAIQKDGKIVVVGGARASSMENTEVAAVMRLLADGSSPDPLFAGGGWGFENAGTGCLDDEPRAVKLQSDGKIVIAGYGCVFDPSRAPNDFGITRLNTNGTFDDTFIGNTPGSNAYGVMVGFETYNGNSTGEDDQAYTLAIDSADRIYAVGQAQFNGGDTNMAVARLYSDKIFVNTFESRQQ